MVHVIITGTVQGVGFRQYVRYKARKLNITGWVKNLPDGRVEALLEGDARNVQKMVEICKRGPFLAKVKSVDVNWNHKNAADIIGFTIIKE